MAIDAIARGLALQLAGDISLVADYLPQIDTLATNINAVLNVSPYVAEIQALASITGSIVTVASISAAISTTAGNTTNISTVALNITAVQTCAANIGAIIAAPAGSAALFKTEVSQIIGLEPQAGSASNSATIIYNPPVAVSGSMIAFSIRPNTSGNILIGRYTLSGTTMTRVIAAYVIPITVTTPGELQRIVTSIPVVAGEYIGAAGTGRYTFTTTPNPVGYYTGIGANVPSSGTVTLTYANSYFIEFEIETTQQIVTANAFQTLEAKIIQLEQHIAELGRQDAIISISAANRPPLPSAATWLGLFSYGQSLGNGWRSTPVISVTQRQYNKTFGSGPLSAKPANAYGALNTSPGTTTAIPLVESAPAVAADGSTISGETPCTGAAETFVELCTIDHDIDPAMNVVFASAPGHGGYTIAQLSKSASSTAWWNNLVDHVTQAKARAADAGKGFTVPAVSWMQGESDPANATYATQLLQLQTDIDAMVKGITLQTTPVHLLIYQTPSGTPNPTIPRLAQIAAVNARPELIHFVSPVVHMPAYSGDNVHLTSVAELWYSRMLGRALKQLVMEGRKPDCVWPISAYSRDTLISVKMRVPRGPLLLDAAMMGAVTAQGFKVTDDLGTLTILSVVIAPDGVTVQITVNRALSTNPVVRYGLDYASVGNTFLNSANGTMRDSTTDTTNILGIDRSLANVSPSFSMPIFVLSPTP